MAFQASEGGFLQDMLLPRRPVSVNTLPSEIISLILTSAMPGIEGDNWGNRLWFRFPSIANRISRRFYQVVLSTPSLWSFLYITPTSTTLELAHIQDRINQKSGALPLDIRLVEHGKGFQDGNIVDILSTCSTRWNSFSVSATYPPEISNNTRRPYITHQTWNLLHMPAPSLRKVSFTSIIPKRPNSLMVHPPFSFPTSLRSLLLINCSYSWGLPKFNFPPHLQELNIYEHRGHIPLCLIKETLLPLQNSLRTLSLGGITNIGGPKSRTLCTLHRLEELELSDFSPRNIAMLLTQIQTPHLHTMSLESIAPDEPERPPLDEAAKLRRWKDVELPALVKLKMDSSIDKKTTWENWIGLLQRVTHTVTDLFITRSGGIYDELKGSEVGLLLGKLRHLSLRRFAAAEIISIIKGRCNSLEWLEVHEIDLRLPPGSTKKQFDDNLRDVDQLKNLVNLRVVPDRLPIPLRFSFATWEEWKEHEAKMQLKQDELEHVE